MDHSTCPLEGVVKERSVENRPDKELDAVNRLKILWPPARQVIDYNQAVDERLVPQDPAQVGSDEAGSTGDDDVHLPSPFQEKRERGAPRRTCGAGMHRRITVDDDRTFQSTTRVGTDQA